MENERPECDVLAERLVLVLVIVIVIARAVSRHATANYD